jgi:hypothetical protein
MIKRLNDCIVFTSLGHASMACAHSSTMAHAKDGCTVYMHESKV